MKKKKRSYVNCKKCKKLHYSQLRRLCSKRIIIQKPIITILMGAGAAKIWGGPLASDIDRLFESDTHFTNTDNVPVGTILFQKLREHYGRASSVNFETCINLIEQIFDFVISSSNQGGTDPNNTSMLPIIVGDSEFINSLYNEGKARELAQTENDNDVLKRVYFMEMISNFLRIVWNQIDIYENRVAQDENLNSKLFEWLAWLSKRYRVRLYTTNYDRIIPDLLDQKQFPFFDGFYETGERGKCKPDIRKISNNYSGLSYFQLHGSIHWEPIDFDFAPYDFVLCRITSPDHRRLLHLCNQPGQILLKSSIVAGYSKPQRLMLSPLNALYSSFINDCHRSSVICAVGFSFGDPHLTKAVISSLDAANTKFVNIIRECSLQEVEDGFNNGIYDNISRCLGIFYNGLETRMDEHLIVKDERFYTYHGGFKNFLERSDWMKIDSR